MTKFFAQHFFWATFGMLMIYLIGVSINLTVIWSNLLLGRWGWWFLLNVAAVGWLVYQFFRDICQTIYQEGWSRGACDTIFASLRGSRASDGYREIEIGSPPRLDWSKDDYRDD